MIVRHPSPIDIAPTSIGIRTRIKRWFQFDMEALANATIAISALYGAPISYVPHHAEGEKQPREPLT